MKIKTLTSLCLLYFLSNLCYAQELVPGHFIVKTSNKEAVEQILYSSEFNKESSSKDFTPLSERLDLWMLKIDDVVTKLNIIHAIRSLKEVDYIVQDRYLEFRNTPNDPLFGTSSDMEVINAIEAWGTTTGGMTSDGKEIVVAILDEGYDITHPDLVDNIWTNGAEIPNDNIDNDNNGLIDDYQGWDFQSNQPNEVIDSHGNAVAGIIGAKGNNGIGVTGINWDIKMMCLRIRSVSSLIQAYEYIIDQRELYNNSNGSLGAYIVSTNLSAGINAAFPEDLTVYTDWCNMYDALGEVGILNVAATTNSNVNVDEQGDMPSLCTSPYLITVTDTDTNDVFQDKGFGVTHVDMSAPGTGTFTVYVNDQYDDFSDASAATPHVTGAIALIHSLPCTNLAESMNGNPSQGALLIKNAILDGTTKLPALNGITSSGGRLDITGAFQILSEVCEGGLSDLALLEIEGFFNSDGQVVFNYSTDRIEEHEFLVVDMLGRVVWSQKKVPSFFGSRSAKYMITDLIPGNYVISISNSESQASKAFSIIR